MCGRAAEALARIVMVKAIMHLGFWNFLQTTFGIGGQRGVGGRRPGEFGVAGGGACPCNMERSLASGVVFYTGAGFCRSRPSWTAPRLGRSHASALLCPRPKCWIPSSATLQLANFEGCCVNFRMIPWASGNA